MIIWMMSLLLNVQVGNIYFIYFLCQHNQLKMLEGESVTHSGSLDISFRHLPSVLSCHI